MTIPFTAALDGIDKGARVHHVNVPQILGTVTTMGAFVATVAYDNGVTMPQSLHVLRVVLS